MLVTPNPSGGRPVRRLAPLAAGLAALTAAGCAPWLERPFAGLPENRKGDRVPPVLEATLPCVGGRDASRLPGRPGAEVVAIGSVLFRGLGRRHRPWHFRPGTPSLPVRVLVPAWRRVTIAVPSGELHLAGLDTGPVETTAERGPHRAVRCAAGGRSRLFTVYFAVRRPMCVRVSVTDHSGTVSRAVPFGVRRCRPAAPTPTPPPAPPP